MAIPKNNKDEQIDNCDSKGAEASGQPDKSFQCGQTLAKAGDGLPQAGTHQTRGATLSDMILSISGHGTSRMRSFSSSMVAG